MNVLKTHPEQVASGTREEYLTWLDQWVVDFKNISSVIRQQKNQVAHCSRATAFDNSSFNLAGLVITQRNLADCKSYARALMEVREAVVQKRKARYSNDLAKQVVDRLATNPAFFTILMKELEGRSRVNG